MPPNAILVGFAMAAKLALNRKTDFSKQLLIIDKLWGRTPEQPQSKPITFARALTECHSSEQAWAKELFQLKFFWRRPIHVPVQIEIGIEFSIIAYRFG
jgi:hypothetical protein